MPHGASKEWVERARSEGARAVDLSADLRPGNGCEGIAYGLTELNRELVVGAELVANPGCYPTSILVALAPLVERGLIAPGATIVANSASGVTGAGNSPKRELLFGEVTEDFRAYGIGNTHRHLNEMRATLDQWGADADLVFTPHLLPVARGILSTITVPLTQPLDDALAPWRDAYAGEPFIEIVVGHAVAARRRASQRRSHLGDDARRYANADAARDVGDRQSAQGRRGAGGTERQPHARPRRDRGVAVMTRVIKIGGRPQSDPRLATTLASGWSRTNGGVVLVHGGGDEVSTLQAALGGSTKFVNGRRVTTEKDIDLVRMALSGSANKRLVANLVQSGIDAVGLSGEDAALIGASPMDAERLGHVGIPKSVNVAFLRHLLSGGYLPVISPVSRDESGTLGAALNVNGDDAAAAIAVALGAAELLLVADVAGVMRDGEVIPELSPESRATAR